MITEERFTDELLDAFIQLTDTALPPEFDIDMPLAELGMDSLSRIELVSQLEERLGVVIDNASLAKVTTVRDLFAVVAPRGTVGADGA